MSRSVVPMMALPVLRPSRRPIGLFLLGLALILCRSEARAESAQKSDDAWLRHGGTISFFYGRNFYDGSYGLPERSEYGFRVGGRITPFIDLELSFQRVGTGTVSDAKSTLFVDNSVVPATGPVDFRSESLQARVLVSPTRRTRSLNPYVVGGFGRLRFYSSPGLRQEQRGADSQGTFIFGAGLRQFLTRHVALRFEYTGESTFERLEINQAASVGLSFELNGRRPADSDRDGVIDFRDRCPDTPLGGLVDPRNGCPYDLDGDGVPDGLDLCPGTPAGFKVDAHGCPLDTDGDLVPDALDACPGTLPGSTVDARGCPSDEDGDGVPDGIDRCPGTVKGAQVDPVGSQTPGCTHDPDGDGVPAGLDKCAGTPRGVKVDADGCPLDSDGDGVYDGLDLCPDSLPGRMRDQDGCPRIRLDHGEPQVLQNVRFLKGDELYPGAEAWVFLAAEAMEYWPDLRVEIAVYTDAGAEQAQRRLAQKRAERIRALLIEKGIAPERIVAVGMGAIEFLAANDSTEGRALNNRVTIRRLSGSLDVHPAPGLREPGPPAPDAEPLTPPEPGSASPP